MQRELSVTANLDDCTMQKINNTNLDSVSQELHWHPGHHFVHNIGFHREGMVYFEELPFDVRLHNLPFLKPLDTILGFKQMCFSILFKDGNRMTIVFTLEKCSVVRDASTNHSIFYDASVC